MPTIKEVIVKNDRLLLWVAIAVLVTFVLFKSCQKTPVNEDMIVAREEAKHLKEIRIKDSTIAAAEIAKKDVEIAGYKVNDGVIVTKLATNDKKTKASVDRVNSLTDLELTREVTARYDH